MRDLAVELKQMRLHGMAGAWTDLVEQGTHPGLDTSRWLLEHLLQAETTDRALRSVNHQMHAARFPVHRDLAGFDFDASPGDRKLVLQLAETGFTVAAQNTVLVGGPGTGKTHLATAIGVAGITRHGKRVRFYSTVDLVNALEQEKIFGRTAYVSGIVMTKLDGTARGGVLVPVAQASDAPIKLIGVGEGIDDLQPFDARAFSRSLVGLKDEAAA